jgi:outer membrane lipoprotein carrier protein
VKQKTALITFFICIFLTVTPCISEKTLPADASNQQPLLSSEQIIERLEKRYASADFSASFFQESTLKAMDISDTATGKVWFKHPDMMRWEYETPEKYAIISDGKTLWIYRPDDNQVVIGDAMAYFGNGKGASFLSNFKLVQDTYTVSAVKSVQADQYTLKLEPAQKQFDVSAIFLNINQKTSDIVNVTTLNAYGDETQIKFSNLIFKELDASLFHFKIPPNTDVLKLDE